jgi:cell filamentation protein
LRAFHRAIFGDIYPWAGELRTVAISKPGAIFALPDFIEPYGRELLGKLSAERATLASLDRGSFLDRLTYYYAELNALHPFRDGNGRVERAFLAQLVRESGRSLDFSGLDPARNIRASQSSHRGDTGELRALLEELLGDDSPS